MIDEEIDRLIAIGLESSRWATKAPIIPMKNSTPSNNAVDKPTSTDRIYSPLLSPTPVVQVQLSTTSASEEPIVVDHSISEASSITSTTSMSHDAPILTENTKRLPCLPELQEVIEAEKRRAAQTAANIVICTVAINGVEVALAPLATDTQNNFVVSLKVYLRSAIAHFLRSVTKANPPILPTRPTNSSPAVPLIRNTARCVPLVKFNPPHTEKK